MQEPSARAHSWVEGLLASRPRNLPEVFGELAALPKDVQVAVLRECVARMPLLRDEGDYAAGSALYEVACHLYSRKLPLDEHDVCALLATSRHTCGHGSDVSAPLDIAQSWMLRNGYSQPIVNATRTFIAALRGIGSAQANFAKRRSAIMLLADPEESGDHEDGWSRHFRAGLRAMTGADRTKWQRLILQMKANDVYVRPGVWNKQAQRILSELGATPALEQIAWWIGGADEPAYARVRTGGSHVLKHLVWLLDEIAGDGAYISACDTVAARLTAIDWTPKDRAAKFMIAAAYYWGRRPPAVAFAPLQQLARWSGETSGKIHDVVREYGAR